MAPPGSPQQPNPQTLQFLSNILSQRGPTSLPYSEDAKWLIRQHLISLTDTFPSLHIKTASFTHNDGRSVNLLQSEGTIPMLYQNVTYNIPIIIWLLELYPRHPPLVYVNPTRDMIIKRPHSHVTPSGLVNLPYLQNWVYPSSNLVDLARNLSSAFARDPPLYSQRRSPPIINNNNNINHSHVTSNQSHVTPHVTSNTSHVTPHVTPFNGHVTPGNSYPGSPYGGRATTEDPNEVYKRNAVNKLVERVHADVAEMRKGREGEMDAMFGAQAELRRREEKVRVGLKEMNDEKEGLENQLQVVLTNADVLDSWLRENEEKIGKLGSGGGVEVDDAFVAGDVLSKQMVEASASDLAIEDVIYALDKAVQDGAIPFDQYMRNVRLLAREQFFHRATSGKVRAAQMQARVASMAARTSQYVL